MDKEELKREGGVPPEGGREKLPDKKNKLIWSFLSVAIAALTIWAVVSQNKDFSLSKMIELITSSDPWWLIAAVVSMLCYIGFETLAILCILKEFGYKFSFKKGLVFSSADIYFSAITPSATGGQPASIFFMRREGVSMTDCIMLAVLERPPTKGCDNNPNIVGVLSPNKG